MTTAKERVEYAAGKALDEAIFEAAAHLGHLPGFDHVDGMDEGVRVDGRVYRLRYEVEEYTPQAALRDLSIEVRRGAEEEDPDATLLVSMLRRAGYEGQLRNPRHHLAYVEEALTGIDALDLDEECPAAAGVAVPYLRRKRAQLLRVIEACEAAR